MLVVDGLHKYFGGVRAVDDVSFAVESGALHGVIGPNGSGKMTVFNVISGVYRPDAGKVLMGSDPITGLTAHAIVRRVIARTFQNLRLFRSMTALENVLVPNAWCGTAAVYALFPILAERRMQPAAALSGGEQQMLALGRALMTKPQLLVLDEPSLGLAPIIVDQVLTLLRRLNEDEGLSILLVEQNAHAALRLAHRALVLETGTVRLRGSAAELRDDPLVREVYLGH